MSKSLPPIPEVQQFLSRIPGRNHTDKIHKTVGQAKTAVNYYFNGFPGNNYTRNNVTGRIWAEKDWKHTGPVMEIYELVDGAWSLLYEIKPGDEELPWHKGRLQAFRDQYDIYKMNSEQRLKADILARAEKELVALKRAGKIGAFSDDTPYYVGYEDGFRAAKELYDDSL